MTKKVCLVVVELDYSYQFFNFCRLTRYLNCASQPNLLACTSDLYEYLAVYSLLWQLRSLKREVERYCDDRQAVPDCLQVPL